MTGPLPDYLHAHSPRDGRNLLIARRGLPQSIVINEHCSTHVGCIILALPVDYASSGKLNEGQGVSAARPEQVHVQVDIASPILEQAAHPNPIAALTLAFAA